MTRAKTLTEIRRVNAERQRASRARRDAAGLVRVEYWVRPEDREQLHAFVERLRLRKQRR